MPVSFRSELFPCYILIKLCSETYSRKYKKLPNIIIHEGKNITEKMNLLNMCGPLCLFTLRPIASKQLNCLTTIDILSWLGGVVVTHPLWVQEVPGSVPGSGKGFYVWFFALLLLCFYFLSKNTLFVTIFGNTICNVNLFSILNILQDLWPIIRE